ncbi:hypothetical protein WDU94_005905 [Cyamophila willieti]
MPRPNDFKYKYVCFLCAHFHTYSVSNLKTHIGTHFDVRPFACDMCDFRSSRNEKLKVHRFQVHKLR